MRTEARFPAVGRDEGHYESFYLKAAPVEGGRALWIRHTIHKRPGAEPKGSIWFTLFEEGRAPRATKATFDAGSLSCPEGAYVRVEDAEIGLGYARGSVATEALGAEWDLSFEDRHEAFRHLPSDWMYRRSLPRTKLLSPHPGALWSGTVTIGSERFELNAWPGMIGHNWGTEHADRWIWIHGAEFEGGEAGDYIDVGAGRIRLGPVRTPWIANGSLVVGGEHYRLGGLGRTYGTEIKESPTGCEFVIAGKGVTVRGRVSAPREAFVGWIYSDPDSGEHHTVNCSIADLEMRVERPSERHAHLKAPSAAAYELGMRETDHGIELQPYPDG